jgi:hypothetical protein
MAYLPGQMVIAVIRATSSEYEIVLSLAGRLREALPDPPGRDRLSAFRGPVPKATACCPTAVAGRQPLNDAVAEVIEQVIADVGDVFFYDPGVLDLRQRIAAVLRY